MLVCKTHPLDKGRSVDAIEHIPHELYNGCLSSEVYVEQNFDSIIACYSVSSTSLLYSASEGIPSYTLYKYLGFDADSVLHATFENEIIKTNPYLLNISNIEDIGKIDDMNVDPTSPERFETWEHIRYT